MSDFFQDRAVTCFVLRENGAFQVQLTGLAGATNTSLFSY
jgi:hypothetical protein